MVFLVEVFNPFKFRLLQVPFSAMPSLEYSLMVAGKAPSILTVGQVESLVAYCWGDDASSIDESFVFER